VVYPPRGTYGPRLQRDYQLVFLHRGGVEVEIDGRPAALAAGEVALLKPGHGEYFRFARETETHHSWLALRRPPLLPAQLAALEAAPFALPLSTAMAQILDACLAVQGLARDTPAMRAAPGPSPALVPLVTGALVRYLEEAAVLSAAPPVAVHPAVVAAREYLRRHLHERIGLKDVAAAAHVAPEHLVRLFKRETGLTPFRFLWDERVRLGVSLLEHTGLPVGEIATQVGFQTVYHFSRSVRAATGLPPTELRRRSWLQATRPPAG
jgi:AraC-like DNA-binding protein